MTDRLRFAIEAAYEGGRSTLALFQNRPSVELKQDQTPVTLADKQAEALIRSRLAESFPGEAILGEEQGLTGSGPKRWVIDPIDGTKSFISGVPLYATLVSYEDEAGPLVAACYLPALDEMYAAERGSRAFLNGRAIKVRETDHLDGARISMGSPLNLRRQRRLDAILGASDAAQLVRTWCDAYGHMLVAAGRIDAMIDPVVSHWDISAVSLIVREAGGHFSQLNGDSQLGSSALSCTKGLAGQILEACRTEQ